MFTIRRNAHGEKNYRIISARPASVSEEGLLDRAFFTSTDFSKGLVYHRLREEPYRVVGLKKKFPKVASAASLAELIEFLWIDGRYTPGKLFPGSLSIVVDNFDGCKLAVLSGLGIASCYVEVFSAQEQRQLAISRFVPKVNSPAQPLLPPGRAPVMYLVHGVTASKEVKRRARFFVDYFQRKFAGPV